MSEQPALRATVPTQPLTPADPRKAPGHTCPGIDRVQALVRKLGRDLGTLTPGHRAALVQQALGELEELRAANERLRDLAGVHRTPRYRAIRSQRTFPGPTWNVLDTDAGALVRTDNGARVRGYSTEQAAQAMADRWSCVCARAAPAPRTDPAR